MSKQLIKSMTALLLSLILFTITILAVPSHSDNGGGGSGGGGFTDNCPGPQGQRQSQAVACYDFWLGQSVVSGCCYGGGNCNISDPCDGHRFKCGYWCNIE